MPTISSGPSSEDLDYYRRIIEEAQENARKEVKRTKEKEEERVNNLEEKHKANLAQKEKQMNRAIQKARDVASDNVATVRQTADAEIERYKKHTYDRFGRYNGQEVEVLAEQLKSLKESSDTQHNNDQQKLSDQENQYRDKYHNLNREHIDDLEKQAATARKSASEAYEELKSNQNAVWKEDKKTSQDAYHRLIKNQIEDTKAEKLKADNAIYDSEYEKSRIIEKAKEANENRLVNQYKDIANKSERQTKQLVRSHADETQMLRDQLRDLLAAESQYMKEKGQGTVDAVREHENEWRMKQQTANDAYKKDIDSLRDRSRESEKQFTHLHNQVLKDKDVQTARILHSQNSENHKTQKDIENSFDRERSQLQLRNKKELQKADQRLEQRMEDATEQKTRALEEQARAYQSTMGRNTATNKSIISDLEDELLYKSTSDDLSVVSPSAEAAIRSSMEKQFSKESTARDERSSARMDHLQKQYSQKLKDTVSENRWRESDLLHYATSGRHLERTELMHALDEAILSKEIALRNRDDDHNRITEKMFKEYAAILDRQKRQYEEMMQIQRDEVTDKMMSTRQELEFQLKTAQRNSAVRQNELIRDFEKKLSVQKSDYETLLGETKAQADQSVQDVNRRSNLLMEEQARNYEQKIAQMEMQHKEKERYISQNYEDQMEKLKNSNALLMRKRGLA